MRADYANTITDIRIDLAWFGEQTHRAIVNGNERGIGFLELIETVIHLRHFQDKRLEIDIRMDRHLYIDCVLFPVKIGIVEQVIGTIGIVITTSEQVLHMLNIHKVGKDGIGGGEAFQAFPRKEIVVVLAGRIINHQGEIDGLPAVTIGVTRNAYRVEADRVGFLMLSTVLS